MPNYFQELQYYFTLPQTMYERPTFTAFSLALGIVTFFFNFSYRNRCVETFHHGLICISWISSHSDHLFMCLFVIHISSSMKYLYIFCPFPSHVCVYCKYWEFFIYCRIYIIYPLYIAGYILYILYWTFGLQIFITVHSILLRTFFQEQNF